MSIKKATAALAAEQKKLEALESRAARLGSERDAAQRQLDSAREDFDDGKVLAAVSELTRRASLVAAIGQSVTEQRAQVSEATAAVEKAQREDYESEYRKLIKETLPRAEAEFQRRVAEVVGGDLMTKAQALYDLRQRQRGLASKAGHRPSSFASHVPAEMLRLAVNAFLRELIQAQAHRHVA